MQPIGNLLVQPEMNIQPSTVFQTSSTFEAYKQFAIDLDSHKKKEKNISKPSYEYYFDELEEEIKDLPLPPRFTAESIIKKMRDYRDSDREFRSELNEIYDLKYDIVKCKAFIEYDISHPYKSQLLAEYIYKYLKNMDTFYKQVANDVINDNLMLTYYFYGTDLPDDYLDVLSESYSLENLAVKCLLVVLLRLKNDFLKNAPRFSIKNEEAAFEIVVKRLSKESIKAIINSHTRLFDEIFRTTGGMEHSRSQINWLINIWNAKDLDDLINSNEYSAKNIDPFIFKGYLSNLKEANNECSRLFSKSFSALIENQLKGIDDDIKLAWADMTKLLINPNHD